MPDSRIPDTSVHHIEDIFLSERERRIISESLDHSDNVKMPRVPPWGKILSSPGVLSLSFGHLAANWGAYQLLTLMPTYFNEILG